MSTSILPEVRVGDGSDGWDEAMPLGHVSKQLPKPLHRPFTSLEILLVFAVR